MDQNQKDKEKTSVLALGPVSANPFGSNISGEKAYRRAERISVAIYVLTRYVSDSEPLKARTRSAAHELLKDILELRGGLRMHEDASALSHIHARTRELISDMRLMSIAGFCSRENADMLVRALEELSQFIESAQATALSERIVFNKEDLLVDHVSVRVSRAHEQRPPGMTTIEKRQDKASVPIKDITSGRRATIIDILKDGKKMAIKDIASFVVGCSEKTIQRELAALVSDGTIKREGEKRWSRYFMIR